MDYVTEEEAAQADRVGLWAGRFVLPWEWRRGERMGSDRVRLKLSGSAAGITPAAVTCAKPARGSAKP